jgi:hypothetical protein
MKNWEIIADHLGKAVMLLNEFLKEHRKVEEQERTIAQLKATAAQQQK